MKLADLFARGVTSCGGILDYQHKWIGRVNQDGSYTLNEQGKTVVAGFAPDPAPVVTPAPVAKERKPRHVVVTDDPLDDPLA